MKLLHKKIIYYIVALFCIVSCKKDTEEVQKDDFSILSGNGVFVLNEGNFQWGNASVSFYKYSDGSVISDIFFEANNRPLGDVAQSISIFQDKLYIVVNNSGKIEVINPVDFKSEGIIAGLTSPRYFIGLSTNKAYISDLNANYITIVDLTTLQKSGHIDCYGSTEEMILYNDKVYVSNTRKSYIYIIDPSTDLIIDSILTAYAPNSMVIDKNGKLWVISMGNYTPEIYGCLQRINVIDKNIELSLPFNKPLNIWDKLRINNTKDTLYFFNDGVCKMSIYSTSLPQNAFINQGNKLFYGLAVEPTTGNIYVSDAIDYVQKGTVFIYSPAGYLLKSFKAGIIPSTFCFY
ncbi:MAG TPA: YncE family protein [Bacteroidales bacterium]|nr:YncE family protein [Bacteroidales bacterium]